MTSILIVEDEWVAADRLEKMLQGITMGNCTIVIRDSIEATVHYLKDDNPVDLIYMDINLSDGNSLAIFDMIKVDIPVIFITAYDSYAIDAFKKNALHYLLKPVSTADLENSWNRYLDYQNVGNSNLPKESQGTDTKRILAKFSNKFYPLDLSTIRYFYSRDKISYAVKNDGRNIPLSDTLEDLEKKLPPKDFFRINRQVIVHINGIKSITRHSKARLKVVTEPEHDHPQIVSTLRTPRFKKWLDQH